MAALDESGMMQAGWSWPGACAHGGHALHPSGRRRMKTSLPLVGWARTGVGPGASVTGHKGELQVTFCSILFSFCFSFI